MCISILPLIGGMFFPTVIQDVASGETIRTWFFYTARGLTFVHFLLLGAAFFLFARTEKNVNPTSQPTHGEDQRAKD
jgi:hypothetical protein